LFGLSSLQETASQLYEYFPVEPVSFRHADGVAYCAILHRTLFSRLLTLFNPVLLAFEEGQGLCFDRHNVEHVRHNLRSLPRHFAAAAVWSENDQNQGWSYLNIRVADTCCGSRDTELLVPFSSGRRTPTSYSQVV